MRPVPGGRRERLSCETFARVERRPRSVHRRPAGRTQYRGIRRRACDTDANTVSHVERVAWYQEIGGGGGGRLLRHMITTTARASTAAAIESQTIGSFQRRSNGPLSPPRSLTRRPAAVNGEGALPPDASQCNRAAEQSEYPPQGPVPATLGSVTEIISARVRPA